MSTTKRALDDQIQYYLLLALKLSVFIAGVFALYFQAWGAFAYCLISLFLMWLPKLVKSKVKVRLPIEFDLVLVIFMYSAVFLGKAGQAYNHFWWWDVILHTSSGFIIGFIAFLILYIKVEQKEIQTSRWLLGLIIFCVAMAFGGVWEIVEYNLAVIFGGNLTAAGLKDTIQDLLVDGIGGLVMAWFGVRQIFDKRRGFIASWTNNFMRINPRLQK